MHHNNAIVTLKELPSKKVVRETSHSRGGNASEVTVFLPFDTEYAISYNLMDGVRRRLELWIDGSPVTDSLILQGKGDLERFVDSDKRFKFVKATDGAVADPTSAENGMIEVRLFAEKPAPMVYIPLVPDTSKYPGSWPSAPSGPIYPYGQLIGAPGVYGPQGMQGSCGPQGVRGLCGGTQSSSGFPDGNTTLSCNASSQVFGGSLDMNFAVSTSIPCDVGATVEGSKSNQVFGSTEWRGDVGMPLIFKFHVKGRVTAIQPQKAIQCPYCETFNKAEVSHCKKCGAEFVKATA